MRKKKTKGPEIIKFDLNVTYSIPLVKDGLIRHIDNEEIVKGCKITQNSKGNVIVDINGKVQDLFITSESNNKEKLEITKYHNINYEYVEIN
jgi:hypothetical protein